MNEAAERAERDRCGFSRTGDEGNALDAWWRLLNSMSTYDTPESAAAYEAAVKANEKRRPKERRDVIAGIAEGSPAWMDAKSAGIKLLKIETGEIAEQHDLFAKPDDEVARFCIAEEELYEQHAFGGTCPEESDELIDDWSAVAWDEERVMVACPRGVCLIPRTRWAEGFRACPGC